MSTEPTKLPARPARIRRAPSLRPTVAPRGRSNDGELSRGQVVVIFAGAAAILLMMVAVVVDVSWLWSNALRVQRAADAAALAGAVTLPNAPGTGVTLANAEARRNGYTSGAGVTVSPAQDAANPNRMRVTITAPVGTFFMRIVGIPTVNVTRTGVAEYNLPLKMGSPQNYYGVGRFMVPTVTTTGPVIRNGDTGFRFAGDDITNNLPSSQRWNNSNDAFSNNNQYTDETNNGDSQRWNEFGLQDNNSANGVPDPGTTTNGNVTTTVSVTIGHVSVRLQDIHLTPTGQSTNNVAMTNCQVRVEAWIESQNRWSPPALVTVNSQSDMNPDPVVPGTAAEIAAWNAINWTYADLDDNNFEVRLTWLEGTGCGSQTVNRGVQLDGLEASATWTSSTTTKTKQLPSAQNVLAPDGTVLAPQNFWGSMQSYGAPSVQGDAYMTGYQTRKSTANAEYDSRQYYNYAVEVPKNANGGEVWIFDPEFCDTGVASNNVGQGAGDNWTVGGSNGAGSPQFVNAYYQLFDMKQTPYDDSDDVLVSESGNLFTGAAMNQSDQFLDGRTDAANSCEGKPYHAQTSAETQNSWWRLASGLGPGLYRVHTSSTLPNVNPSNQQDATGVNDFAIWTRANGGAPKVYGLGTMEAYFGLPANQVSVFYMTQIEKQYAGKWVDIDLWDPGDTGDLTADLEILQPTSGGYTPATFYTNVNNGTTIPANFSCGPSTSSARTSIRTSNGDPNQSGIYNGQWLRLCIQIPSNYTQPKPPGEPFDGGWYKIRYTMGNGSAPATDLTTWRVTIRDNPVHLVTP